MSGPLATERAKDESMVGRGTIYARPPGLRPASLRRAMRLSRGLRGWLVSRESTRCFQEETGFKSFSRSAMTKTRKLENWLRAERISDSWDTIVWGSFSKRRFTRFR